MLLGNNPEVQMFQLKINGTPENFAFTGESTFGEVMEKLSGNIDAQGMVITSITMNNLSLIEGKQFDYHQFPLHQVESIELEIANPVALADEALNSADEHIRMLIGLCARTSELFRLGDEAEANDSYSKMIEGLRWLDKGMNVMFSMLKIDQAEPLLNGKSMDNFQNEMLVPALDNMYSAQTNEDMIALADSLEYELIPVLHEWLKMLTAIKARILNN